MPLSRLPIEILDRVIEVSTETSLRVMQICPDQRTARATSTLSYEQTGVIAAFLTRAALDAKKRRAHRVRQPCRLR